MDQPIEGVDWVVGSTPRVTNDCDGEKKVANKERIRGLVPTFFFFFLKIFALPILSSSVQPNHTDKEYLPNLKSLCTSAIHGVT